MNTNGTKTGTTGNTEVLHYGNPDHGKATAMNTDMTKNWDEEYREAFEVAKNGNPVLQTAVALACLNLDDDVVGHENAYRLVKEAAEAGFQPAHFIQHLYLLLRLDDEHEDKHLLGESIINAIESDSADALSFYALKLYAEHKINAADLQGELNANSDSILSTAVVAVDRFVAEAEAATKAIRLKDGKIAELNHRLTSCKAHHRTQIDSRNSHVRDLEDQVTSRTKTIASLSASTMARDLESLRTQLAATQQRLSDAESQISEGNILFDVKVDDAVTATKMQLEDAQQARDLAVEERDEALGRAEKAERLSKHFEQWLRKGGINPMETFGNGQAVLDKAI